MKDHAVLASCSPFMVMVCLTASLPVNAVGPISQPPKTSVPAPTLNLMKVPLVFEPSQNQTASEAQFISRGPGYSLFLTPNEAVLVLTKGAEKPRSHLRKPGPYNRLDTRDSEVRESSVVRMKMVGANPTPRLTGRDELSSKSHYFIGNDPSQWRTNVDHYAKVEYAAVYPGVDLVFYGNQRQMEYDFVVAPGVDPCQIQLSFDGMDKMEIDVHGNLVLRMDGGELLVQKPIVYQQADDHNQPVAGSFVLDGKCEARFQIATYDATRALIIDPVLSYSTFLGGSFEDYGSAIAVDSEGNAYVTGYTRSTNFPALNPILPAKSYVSDAFVTKFNAAGQLVYSTYLSGRDFVETRGNAIAVDAAGNAYITGQTESTNFPTVNALQSTNASGVFLFPSDAFVTKLNPTGSALLYSTYLGGYGTDVGYGIALDSTGSAYVTGFTISTNFPTKAPLFPTIHGVRNYAGFTPLDYASDAFVTKLAPSGASLIYSTYLGGTSIDAGSGIVVDASGNAHVVGYTYSVDFPTTNAFQTVFHPAKDAFVTKLNAAGNALIYSTYLGGRAWIEVTPWMLDFGNVPGGQQKDLMLALHNTSSQPIRIFSVTKNNSGDAGRFDLVNPPATPFILDAGQTVTVVVRYHPISDRLTDYAFLDIKGFRVEGEVGNDSGFLLHIAMFGQCPGCVFASGDQSSGLYYDGEDVGRAIAIDAAGNACVAGNTDSPSFPTFGAVQSVIGNPNDRLVNDAFISKFSPAGQVIYSTYLGGTGDDYGNGIAVDQAGNAYVAGSTGSTNFPPATKLSAPVYSLTNYHDDAFIAKLDSTGATLADLTYLGGSDYDSAYGIALDSATNVYVTGVTWSPNFPTLNAAQPVYGGDRVPYRGDAFVAKLGAAKLSQKFRIYEILKIPAPLIGNTPSSVRVQFVRDRERIVADALIVAVTTSNVTVRVPVDLMGPSDVLMPPKGEDALVSVRVISNLPAAPVTNVLHDYTLIFPRCLLYDEVFVPPALDERFVVPTGAIAPPPLPGQISTLLRNLPQFALTNTNDIATFVFVGRSTDGMAGLRVLNSSLNFVRPLSLDTNILVFGPVLPSSTNVPTRTFQLVAPPSQIQNLGSGDGGVQFNVARDGLYVVVVLEPARSLGPFPAPFQIHLAGNVGLPRKRFDDGTIEFPRGTRLDTLFNHSAPRPQGLAGYETNVAQTALFKFANRVSVSQFAVAVLIPPTSTGFPFGTSIVRADDPLFVPLPSPLMFVDPTIPTARTTNCLLPRLGMVIDFTQVPDPASVWTMPSVGGTVCSVIGTNDSLGVTLPLLTAGGAMASTLILDMGSGQEIVDGGGADFKVFALAGNYTVAVANTPYADTFKPIAGTYSGTNQFDLAGTGLTSARYVRVTAAPTTVLNAVQALNVFADQVIQNQVGQNLGPFIKAGYATITMRRAKASETAIDPFLQLITPSGDLFSENESGFGDDLSADLSDAALRNIELREDGFYRFLAKGYDKQPDAQSFGSFFVRLETGGKYDPVDIVVSGQGETNTPVQKTGTISTNRQRDSYVFQAMPGQLVNIVVNGKSLSAGAPALPNPMVELYDPEDFLIAANDDYDFQQRGRNAALSLTLPSADFAGTALPKPSTYRLVVSAIDGFASTSPLAVGTAHIRTPAGGGYEVKVFTGALTGTPQVSAPRIDSINPTTAAAGAQVSINGANFGATTTNNIVLFGGVQATIVAASTNQLVVIVPTGLPSGSASVTILVAGQTSAPANFQIGVPVTRMAVIALHCLSLRFAQSIVRLGSQDYRLDLTSLGDTSPANGELFPLFDPLDFTHASGLLLRAVNTADIIEGFIYVDVPMAADADRDGVADFFQISQAVASTQTQGDYFTDTDDGTVSATWSRAAGSKTGACRLVLRSTTLGQLPAFTNIFELIENTGSLTYTPGSNNVTGTVQFARTQSTSNTLTGPIQFTRSLTNRFNELRFASGRWTNAVNQALIYTNGVVQRVSVNSSNYFGYLGFLDGDPATTDEDYYDWMLSIRDSNDANANGVPDLSDDPSVGSAPVFTRPRVEAGQIVLEWQGAGRLQSASEVSGPWADVIGASNPYRQTPVGVRKYFRIAP